MRVLMFGWEFPPHISGGLGTACYGLSKGLSSFDDIELVFVVPKAHGDEDKSRMKLISANEVELPIEVINQQLEYEKGTRLAFRPDLSAYITPEQYSRLHSDENYNPCYINENAPTGKLCFSGKYGSTLFDEIKRYGIVASNIAKHEPHDIIHAHDWLTYPAGIEAKKISGKPLIVHVHATEFDRSGENINVQVYEIERMGMEAADKVIAVSNLTRRTVIEKYNIPPSKVVTVYNAVDNINEYELKSLQRGITKGRVVTFLGRITMQKGPEYFVEAAGKVLKKKAMCSL